MKRRSFRPAPGTVAPRHVAAGLIATIVLAFCALTLASRIVMPKNNQVEFGQNDASAYGVLGEPRDTIDALFVGDSEAYCAFSPLQLWHERGIASYVCATSGQRLPYTLSLLGRALEHQRPKVVILETNCLFRAFTPTFALNRAAADAFPVVEYHNRWKSLRPEDFTAAPRSTWTHPYKGFRIKTDMKAADATDYMAASTKTESMRPLNRWYVERIAQLCRERGAKLVLVSTPSTKNWNARRHNCVEQLAGQLGVDYIDLNTGTRAMEIAIDWKTDSCDAGDHLNVHGARKVTSEMGRILSRAYQLPDHSYDASYSSWSEAYARYAQKVGESAKTGAL